MKWRLMVAAILGLLVLLMGSNPNATNIVYSEPSVKTMFILHVPQNDNYNEKTCAEFDPEMALKEINITLWGLTLEISQKESQLYRLSKEVNITKDSQLLKRVVELYREVELLKSKRAFYQRKWQSIWLYKQYLNGEYIELTTKDLEEYKDKMAPLQNIKTPEDAITRLSVAGEMTFDRIILIDSEINKILENATNSKNVADNVITRVFLLINNESVLWNKLREYTSLRDELQAKFLLLKSNSYTPTNDVSHNCQLKNRNVKKVNCREIQKGYNEDFECCLSFYRMLSPLESYQTYTFVSLRPVAVWVGMYDSDFPSIGSHRGDWCTYTFPQDNKESTIRTLYWNTAQEISRKWGLNVKSIQIKFFYSARVYRQETRKYEETNLIFEYNCYLSGDSVRCLPSPSYGKSLFVNPKSPPYRYTTKIVTNPYWLACRSGGNCNGYGCQYAKWANAHCGGCFAPDKSASQYFAKS
ncbi:conserved exported protein of unknown function [Thermococcus camini]|uniref:Uncharacterized protein n=1 Tax=Thermococcus camini TaxID=2016373 RepID=A0A7G2D6W7_9EURY|nr:conserved exported protein of unknown function [Thermococcus camini]